jgi:hypothetical protein
MFDIVIGTKVGTFVGRSPTNNFVSLLSWYIDDNHNSNNDSNNA